MLVSKIYDRMACTHLKAPTARVWTTSAYTDTQTPSAVYSMYRTM